MFSDNRHDELTGGLLAVCESTGISLAVIELMSGDIIVSIWLSTVRKIAFRICESDESRIDIITVVQGNDAVAR